MLRLGKIVRRLLVLCALLVTPLGLSQATLHSPIGDCQVLLRKLQERPFDSSVEIETNASNSILSLFTTTDGSVGPVLRGQEAPADIKELMSKEYPEYQKFEDIPWDAFTSEDQRRLILYAAQKTNVNFFKDRVIHGLKTREEATVTFSQPTTFFGKSYSSGQHTINLRDFLTDEIHFRSPDVIAAGRDPEKLGVEMHFRTNLAPGDNLKEAWSFMKSLGHREPSVHQHVVAQLPSGFGSEQKLLRAMKITEYHRRINTYAEMNAVMEGHGILANKHNDIENFGALKDFQSMYIFNHFYNPEKHALNDIGKIAWVGIRGDNYYSEKGTWGLEFRDLDPRYDRGKLQRLLDASQNAMTTQQFGIPNHKLIDWAVRESSLYSTEHIEALSEQNYRHAIRKIHLERTRDGIARLAAPKGKITRSHLPLYLRKYLLKKDLDHPSKALEILTEKQDVNEVVTWLVKDWSREPLLHAEVEFNQRIAEQQYIALRRLENGEKQAEVLQTFLKRSGLLYVYERSLGL